MANELTARQKILSPEWRWKKAKDLYYIRSEVGIVKLMLRPEQQLLHDLVYPAFLAKKKLDVIILKNRQRGTSTHCNLLCLDCTAYYPGKVANTLADGRDNANKMFENNVKLAWDRIPAPLRPHVDKDNVNELIFDKIGSKYMISASKSEPVDILHVSEAPYFPDDGRITEAEQMLRRHGIEIMESTAFGVGNLFEKRFIEAWKAKLAGKQHHRIALFFPWFTDPKNVVDVAPGKELQNKAFIEDLARKYKLTPAQMHFYDQKMADLDDEVFQFYPSEPEEAFLHSGRPVFNQELLKALREKYAKKPIRVTEDGIDVYDEPDNSLHYGIGVDTAEGLEHGDNSVVSVVCKETGREVAQAAGKISAIDEDSLAKTIARVAEMYRNHTCVIERNNHGHTVIAYVKNYSGVHLYQEEERDAVTGKVTKKIGWDTTHKNKAYAIDTLKKGLKEGTCVPQSFETHDELRTFVHGERGAMAAVKGSKDDRVMALSLAHVRTRHVRDLRIAFA